MKKSVFNPEQQGKDVSSKIVAGLERIAEAFRVLLWDHAKVLGLSPIQIQLLIFLNYHEETMCNVSHLAREFNMTKPTISDAVRVLEKKGLLKKIPSTSDKRAFSLQLTRTGRSTAQQTHQFAEPILEALDVFDMEEKNRFFLSLSKLIFNLNRAGILQVQRTCFGCRFYEKRAEHHYCNLLKKTLIDSDIRIDCPEFVGK